MLPLSLPAKTGNRLKAKFYEKGLNFSCTACGACCKIPAGRVEISPAEVRQMADYLKLDINVFEDRFCIRRNDELVLKDNPAGYCIFLVEDQCLVYEARPLQCRTFPFWPENLKSRERWQLLKLFCPGIDEGEYHRPETISDIRRRQREYDRQRKAETENS